MCRTRRVRKRKRRKSLKKARLVSKPPIEKLGTLQKFELLLLDTIE